MADFVPGLDLTASFFHETLQPLLADAYPRLRYAAARLGSGSDVLGYDTPMSMDHDWGVRMQLFLPEAEYQQLAAAVDELLRRSLPHRWRGHAVHFGPALPNGSRLPGEDGDGPVDHRITITTAPAFMWEHLRLRLERPLSVRDWLFTPQQKLLEVTAGRVFVDEIGDLTRLRQTVAYYPHDLWLYLLACQWTRIAQEDHLMARAGFAGDELGARVMAARLAHDVMQLGFLMARRYAPYPKWFGTAFARLPAAARLTPLLQQLLAAAGWQARQAALCAVCEQAAALHNELGVTPPLAAASAPYYERPFQVIHADRFVDSLRAAIKSEKIRALPAAGSVDQFSHSTDLRENVQLLRRLGTCYTGDAIDESR